MMRPRFVTMKNKITTLLLAISLLSSAMYAQNGWIKSIGGTTGDVANDVIQTTDGGYLLCGTTYSFGAGGPDVYLVKTNSVGDITWSGAYGTTNGEYGNAVLQAADGGYVVAGNLSNNNGIFAYLMKVSSNGTLLWSNSASTYYSSGATVSQLGSDYVVTGAQGSSLDAIVVAKFSSSGNLLAQNKITIDGSITANATAAYPFQAVGRIIVAGTIENVQSDIFVLGTNVGPNCAWATTISSAQLDDVAFDMAPTADSGSVVIGWTNAYGAGSSDVYLLRLDPSGNLIWAKTYGGTGQDSGYGVIQTSDGGFLLSTSIVPVGPTLIKTDASGNIQWTSGFDGTNKRLSKVIQTTDSGYLAVGGFQGKMFLVKIDANGNSGCVQSAPTITVGTATPTVDRTPGTFVIASSIGTNPHTWQKSTGGTAADGCIVKTDDQFVEPSISIFPNPATAEFYLQLPSKISSATVSIHDQLGKVVGMPIANLHNGNAISIADLVPGLYFVRVNTPNARVDLKIFKR